MRLIFGGTVVTLVAVCAVILGILFVAIGYLIATASAKNRGLGDGESRYISVRFRDEDEIKDEIKGDKCEKTF